MAKKLLDTIKFLLRLISCVSICLLVVIVFMQVINRNFFDHSFTWVEEVASMAMVFITYLGAAMATINNGNTRIDFFIRKLPTPVYNAFELLDDVIVEIRQAIEMTSIYRDDIKGTRELFSSILDNRLNNAMKYLTSITLLMAVPTVISGLYGMNVRAEGMPFASSTAGFAIVLGLTLALCVFAAWVLHKKHML